MTTLPNPLATRIQFLMQKQQLCLETLAQSSGLSPWELKQYLNNREPLTSIKKLSRLALALQLTLPQLILGSPAVPSLAQDEKQLLLLFRQLAPEKKEVLHAYLKGCQYSQV